MTSRFVPIGFCPALLFVMMISGCDSLPGAGQRGAAMTDSASSSSTMNDMGKRTMCEKHRKMMAAQTMDERTALMDERMKSMSPEMLHQHVKMMQQHCAE